MKADNLADINLADTFWIAMALNDPDIGHWRTKFVYGL